MDSLTLLTIGGLLGFLSCLSFTVVTYWNLSRSKRSLSAEIKQAEKDLFHYIRQLDIAELKQTKAGRELLALLTHGASSERGSTIVESDDFHFSSGESRPRIEITGEQGGLSKSDMRFGGVPPVAYLLSRTLGYLFGLRWVGDNQVAVIYRLERYHSLKGPGFFWINPFTQTVRRIISTAPEFVTIEAVDIHTQDALQLDLAVALAYLFDPALMPPEKAALYVTWTRETHRAIITDDVKRALQAVVPSFYAEDICRGKAFAEIERQVMSELATRVKPLALKPMICYILHVTVPPRLRDRFEAIVQRQVNVEDLSHYAPYELTQALRIEIIEALGRMSRGEEVSLTDFPGVAEEIRSFLQDDLTDVERSVAELIAREGLTDEQIGERLSLPSAAIEKHRLSVYEKTQAHWQFKEEQHQLTTMLLQAVFMRWGSGAVRSNQRPTRRVSHSSSTSIK